MGFDGKEIHKTLIYHTKLYLEDLGYRVLSPETCKMWLMFKVKSDPDILAEKFEKWTDTKGRKKTHVDRIIVEVETNGTPGARKKKEKLYENQIELGWVLIFMDVRKIKGMRKGWDNVKMKNIKAWMRDYI